MATLLRGPLGFGHSSRLHTAKILRLSADLPIVIEIVDNEERPQSFPTVPHRAPSTDCVTDAELVERARQGQTAAFGELVERHRHAVVRAAYAALGNRADADDAAQEACVLAYERLAQFRGESSFKTWLIAITWRTAMTRRRSWVRWARRQFDQVVSTGTTPREGESARVLDLVPAAGQTPEQALIDGDRVAMIRRLIEALPAKLREAILLAASGEVSYEEAAGMIGVPVGTFKWRVSEARRHLREKLQRLGYEYE